MNLDEIFRYRRSNLRLKAGRKRKTVRRPWAHMQERADPEERKLRLSKIKNYGKRHATHAKSLEKEKLPYHFSGDLKKLSQASKHASTRDRQHASIDKAVKVHSGRSQRAKNLVRKYTHPDPDERNYAGDTFRRLSHERRGIKRRKVYYKQGGGPRYEKAESWRRGKVPCKSCKGTGYDQGKPPGETKRPETCWTCGGGGMTKKPKRVRLAPIKKRTESVMIFHVVENFLETSRDEKNLSPSMRRQHRAQRKAVQQARIDRGSEASMRHWRKQYASYRKMKGTNVDLLRRVAKGNFHVARKSSGKRKLP